MDFQGRQTDPTWREEDWACGHFMPIFGSSVNSQTVHVFFCLGSCLGEKVKMNLTLVFAV